MKNLMFILISGVVFSGCTLGNQEAVKNQMASDNFVNVEVMEEMESTKVSEDLMVKEMTDGMQETIMNDANLYTLSGLLADVTNGEVVSGVDTRGVSGGTALAGYTNDVYNLYVTFFELSAPSENHFYEGWVVRKSPFVFVSTGVVEIIDGLYTNTYMSGTDYTDYDFYVLTIEPTDDGINGKPDPAPAAHILEGTMSLISQ